MLHRAGHSRPDTPSRRSGTEPTREARDVRGAWDVRCGPKAQTKFDAAQAPRLGSPTPLRSALYPSYYLAQPDPAPINLPLRLGNDATHVPAEPGVTRMLRLPR